MYCRLILLNVAVNFTRSQHVYER